MKKFFSLKNLSAKSTLLLCIVALCFQAKAQNIFPASGSAGIGTIAPAASSALEIKSTTQGLLIPRMTIAQRNAITSPATGLMIYQSNSTPGFYYFTGNAWAAMIPKTKAWSLTGNAGTDSAVNFLGTTDQQPLIFKVGDTLSGYIDPVSSATGFGYGTLAHSPVIAGYSGNFCSAFGYAALHNNTTAIGNTGVGYNALYSTTTGSYNTATGSNALYFNTTGIWNAAYSPGTLYQNTSGSYNVAYGVNALDANTTGNNNVAIGVEANTWASTGNSNVSVGIRALYWNRTNSNLVAIGDSAMFNQYSGEGFNTGVGSKALFNNISGSSNTALGFNAMFKTVSGTNNLGAGALALSSNTIGNFNTAIGDHADVSANNLSNATALGYAAVATADNQVRIGNGSVTSIGGFANWTNVSDGRVKKNILQNVPGLAFINKLQPVTYNLNLEAADQILQITGIKDKEGKIIQPTTAETAARKAKEQVIYTGFIAQDVEKAAKELNYDFSGVDAAKNSKDLYGLRYSEFVVPLVKAVQELSKMNEDKDAQIAKLNERLTKLENAISKNSAASNENTQATLAQASSLKQNIPNPFNSTTAINYQLPQHTSAASLKITGANGQLIKTISLSDASGRVVFQAGQLAAGIYQYTLIADGKMVDTRNMIIAR